MKHHGVPYRKGIKLNTSNIYHGPIDRLVLKDPLGNDTTFDAFGEAGADITFEPTSYTLNDGQLISKFGVGKFSIDIAEADAATVSGLMGRVEELTDLYIYTYYGSSSSYIRFRITDIYIKVGVKRPFGDDIHLVTIQGSKKVLAEDDFVERQTHSGGTG